MAFLNLVNYLVKPLLSPVMPQINCSIGSGSLLRKSTHVMPSRKIGSSGVFSQSGRITGITGHSRFTNCRRKAASSASCQGPTPFFPTNTAADLIFLICLRPRIGFSRWLCSDWHSVPQRLAYNINQRTNKESHSDNNNHFHAYNSFNRFISLRIFLLIRIRVMIKTTMSKISA